MDGLRSQTTETLAEIRQNLWAAEAGIKEMQATFENQTEAVNKILDSTRQVEECKRLTRDMADGFNMIKSEIDKLWGSVKRLSSINEKRGALSPDELGAFLSPCLSFHFSLSVTTRVRASVLSEDTSETLADSRQEAQLNCEMDGVE